MSDDTSTTGGFGQNSPGQDTSINEQLKKKIDEIDFDARLSQVREGASKAFEQIKEQAGGLLQGNRAKVDEVIEKATTAFDAKTEGKYHDKVSKAKASFASGLDKLQDVAEEAEPAGEADLGTEAAASQSRYDAPGRAGSEWTPVETGESTGEPTTESPDPTAWSTETDKLS